MNHLLAYSTLTALMLADDSSKKLLTQLEDYIQKNHKFFVTAISIFEVIQGKISGSPEDQKEFLNQSGILCDEIYPINKDDLNLYAKLSAQLNMQGLEVLELCVAINRNMETILCWKSKIPEQSWIKIIDLSLEN
ncbi:hypothetical protein [Leptospira sp. GIMC2001]|uniref:hypothetical protein n=1 Tax=Leptospira sp. GIMC2001 TaxID=1513297 RepID=UPI0023493C7E|nr:hypothetical protein [Leptospira sp. GIMC2001]WCL48441.1 hypothetical protein O4O04_14165 [Leptospira sp. GIMC2001]